MTGTAHASDPARAGEAWHEIFLPFGNAMCVDVAAAAPRLAPGGAGGPALCMAAASLSDRDHTPLVALPCEGFQDAAQILELG